MAEAITTVKIQKNSINRWVLHSPLIFHKERTRTSQQFSANPTLMHAAIRHFFVNIIFMVITSTEVLLSTCLHIPYTVYIYRERQKW